jgi:Cysteine-rich secretory protein family/S-layer homology domain
MRAASRRVTSLVAVAMSLVALTSVAAADTDAEADFLSKINATRAAHGLETLRVDDGLRSHARIHSEEMADADDIYHSTSSELIAAAGAGWSGLAENVGVGSSTTSLHNAFLASPAHKKNILGDYNYVGIGTDTSGGRLYVTVVFMRNGDTGPVDPSPSVAKTRDTHVEGTFADDDGNVHEPNIEAIASDRITLGCNPPANTLYCPDHSVTRGAMAAFMARALGLPDVEGDYFRDDDGSTFENAINRVAAAGITRGCNAPQDTRFCPDRPMTRGEMAAFLVRAYDLAPTEADHFGDDGGHIFEHAINALGAARITLGCNPPDNSMFCPDDPIRRDQMATFLIRARDLKG